MINTNPYSDLNCWRCFRAAATSVLISLLVGACAVLQPPDESSGENTRPSQQDSKLDSANQPAKESDVQDALDEKDSVSHESALTPEVLYDLLVANIAQQRGFTDKALDALASAATSTRDKRIVGQAVHDAIRAERYDLALELSQLWSEIEPGASSPLGALAHVYMQLGRSEEAYLKFKKIIKQAEPTPGQTYQRIAELMGRQEDGTRVLSMMEKLIELHPESHEAHYAKAYLAGRYEEFELAGNALDQALVIKPDWETAALAKISNLARQKKHDEVRTYANTYLKQNQGQDRFRLQFARFLVDQNENEQALVHFETIAGQQPDNADAVYAAGLLQLELENHAASKDYFLKHLKLRPKHDQTRLYLSEVAEQQEEYDNALKWLEEVADGQHRFDAQLRMAGVLAKRDGLERGLTHLDNLPADSEEAVVRVYLSKEQLLREEKLLDRAKLVMDEGLKQYPDNTELLYSRGLILAQLKQVDLHEKDLRKLIAKQPDNAHAYNALGYTLADLTDRFEEAFELISKALELRPEDPFILDSMGWVHYRMGNNKLALDYLERAMKVREDAEIAAHLGEVLWVLGEQNRAKLIWQRGAEIGPDNEVLRETIEQHLPE